MRCGFSHPHGVRDAFERRRRRRRWRRRRRRRRRRWRHGQDQQTTLRTGGRRYNRSHGGSQSGSQSGSAGSRRRRPELRMKVRTGHDDINLRNNDGHGDGTAGTFRIFLGIPAFRKAEWLRFDADSAIRATGIRTRTIRRGLIPAITLHPHSGIPRCPGLASGLASGRPGIDTRMNIQLDCFTAISHCALHCHFCAMFQSQSNLKPISSQSPANLQPISSQSPANLNPISTGIDNSNTNQLKPTTESIPKELADEETDGCQHRTQAEAGRNGTRPHRTSIGAATEEPERATGTFHWRHPSGGHPPTAPTHQDPPVFKVSPPGPV